MVDLDVLVVVRFGRRRLTANVARERTLARVYPLVLRQVVLPVELAVADFARVVFLRFVLARVPDPVVLPDELAPAVIARVRPDRLVSIHVGNVVGLADKPGRAQITLERFERRVGVRPLVLLQVPVGAEQLIAYGARIGHPLVSVGFHVSFHARFDVRLVTDRTHLCCRFQLDVFLGVRQADVPGETVFVDELLATERTTLGFVFVDFLVPLHFGLRLEHFTAVTHKVLLRRYLVQVMSIAVLSQIRESPEVLIAVGTLEWRFACVYPHMLNQLLLDHKLLPA